MGISLRFMVRISVLAAIVNHIVCAEGQCYYPGGASASNQFRCDRYAYTTLCCPTGWTCFSNKLCVATDPNIVSSSLPLGTSIRGTCTNPNWDSGACGNFCMDELEEPNNGSLKACNNNKWCCQTDADEGLCDCSSGRGTFEISDGQAETMIGVVGLQHMNTSTSVPTRLGSTATLSSTANSSGVSSSSTTMSTLNSLSITTSISSATPSNISVQTGPQASQISRQSLDSSPIPVTESTVFKASIGVAGAVFFFAAVGLCWFFCIHGRGNGRVSSHHGFGKPPWMYDVINYFHPLLATPPPHPNPHDLLAFTGSAYGMAPTSQPRTFRYPRPFQLGKHITPIAEEDSSYAADFAEASHEKRVGNEHTLVGTESE